MRNFLITFILTSTLLAGVNSKEKIDNSIKNIKEINVNQKTINYKQRINTKKIEEERSKEKEKILDGPLINKEDYQKSLEQESLNGKKIEAQLKKEDLKIKKSFEKSKLLKEITDWTQNPLSSSEHDYLIQKAKKLLEKDNPNIIDEEKYFDYLESRQEALPSLKRTMKKVLFEPPKIEQLERESNLNNQELSSLQAIYDDWIIESEVDNDFVFKGEPRTCEIILGKNGFNSCTQKGIVQKILGISKVNPKETNIANEYFKDGYCIHTGEKQTKFLGLIETKVTHHFCCFKSPIEKAYHLKAGLCQKNSCPGIPIEMIEEESHFDKDWFDAFVLEYYRKH